MTDPAASAAASPNWFPSRRDSWVSMVLWGSNLVLIWVVAMLIAEPADDLHWIGRVFVLAICGAALVLTLWIQYGTGYGLMPDHLLVSSGPIRWRIPYGRLVSITATSRMSFESGAVLSVRRRTIRYHRTDTATFAAAISVSPERETQFVTALRERAPQMTIVDR